MIFKCYVDLILFDLDGTLVDSRKDIANAVNFTLNKLGFETKSIEEISSYIGGGVESLISKSIGRDNGNLFDRALSVFEEYYRKHSTDESRLYAGVKETLEYFRNKRKIVVTNRNYEFAVITLKILGIYDCFEDITGGDDASCLKPSSCPLDRAVDKFKADKNKTIIIGDMYLDILAGKRAGIVTCAVTYGIGKKGDILKANPDYIVDNIIELKKIIK